MDKIEQLKSLEALFLTHERQAEEVRQEIIKLLGKADLRYDEVAGKPVYGAEFFHNGISFGWQLCNSLDELLKYHVIEED